MSGIGGTRVGGSGVEGIGGGVGGSGTEGDPEGGGGVTLPPFSPLNNWDFSDADTVTLSGSEITDITDRVGDANMTRVTEGPDQAVAFQNGLNGADIGTISTGSRGLRTGTSNPTGYADETDFTIGIVCDIGAVANTPLRTLLNWANGAYSAGWSMVHPSGLGANVVFWSMGSNQGIGVGSQIQTADEGVRVLILTIDESATTLAVYRDGDASTPIDTDNIGEDTGNPNNGVRLGGDDFGGTPMENAIVGEIVVYNSLLDSGDRAELFTYLNDKWAVF